jgi:hypothetical protein
MWTNRLRVERLENREVPAGLFAVGTDVGGEPTVKVFDSNGSLVSQRLVFEPGFRGGVKATVADVTGDGVPDLIAAAGLGGGPRVRVFDGQTDQVLADFFAYDIGFRGGVNVAAGDFDGDETAEIVVGAGVGGGPHVRVLLLDGTSVLELFAYEPTLSSGVHVAAGDLNGDGVAELITGAPQGGGPRVRYFRGDGSPIRDFFAYDPGFDGGVHVAAGDLNGDGRAEVVTGPGTGGGPHVRVFDQFGGERASFFADTAQLTYGTPLAVSTVGVDGKAVIVTGGGPGSDGGIVGFGAAGNFRFERTALDHREGVAFGSGSGYTVSYSEVLAAIEAAERRLAAGNRDYDLDAVLAAIDDDVDEWDEADDFFTAYRLLWGW